MSTELASRWLRSTSDIKRKILNEKSCFQYKVQTGQETSQRAHNSGTILLPDNHSALDSFSTILYYSATTSKTLFLLLPLSRQTRRQTVDFERFSRLSQQNPSICPSVQQPLKNTSGEEPVTLCHRVSPVEKHRSEVQRAAEAPLSNKMPAQGHAAALINTALTRDFNCLPTAQVT